MKRVVLLMSLLLTVSVCTFAQKAKGGESKTKKTVEKLDAVLDLDDKQETKILEIYSKPKDQRGKVDAQLKEILTAEQFKKYQDYKAVEKAKRAEKGNNKERGDKKGNKKKG